MDGSKTRAYHVQDILVIARQADAVLHSCMLDTVLVGSKRPSAWQGRGSVPDVSMLALRIGGSGTVAVAADWIC